MNRQRPATWEEYSRLRKKMFGGMEDEEILERLKARLYPNEVDSIYPEFQDSEQILAWLEEQC